MMIKTNPLSVKEIERLANVFRLNYNINNDDAFPILDVIDDMFENKILSLQVLDDDNPILDEMVPACYVPKENFIYVKESVLEEYETDNYRSAFTLCHELFHYVQAQVLKFDFEEVETCKTYEDIDWQANEFAGQLLIPTSFIEEDSEKLIEMFHVSLECVLTRKAKYKQRKEFVKLEKE